MPARRRTIPDAKLIEEWPLPSAASLESSVRSKGIFLEVRARLPQATKKFLSVAARVLALRMPEGADVEFQRASAIVSAALKGIEDLPVIPREAEDVLTITSGERHRWLKDGRL